MIITSCKVQRLNMRCEVSCFLHLVIVDIYRRRCLYLPPAVSTGQAMRLSRDSRPEVREEEHQPVVLKLVSGTIITSCSLKLTPNYVILITKCGKWINMTPKAELYGLRNSLVVTSNPSIFPFLSVTLWRHGNRSLTACSNMIWVTSTICG
jgi:hypothetical protein